MPENFKTLKNEQETQMIGAILLGFVAGTVGRLLVPDMWSGLSGPKSWLFSLLGFFADSCSAE